MRLLSLTVMAFNIGFFMVLPYLSVHLTQDLGLTAAVVGLALGLRTVSQQGLFFVGGSLADRYGVRPVTLLGIGVRVVGFVALALSQALAPVLLSVVLIGLAAALFSPATESELARQAGLDESTGGARRTSVFALYSVYGQIGTFAGPLVGAVLLLVDFRVACLVAAGVFVVILAAHVRWLPDPPPAHAAEPVLTGWREVAGNRRFVLFTVFFSGQLVAYNQLYLLLPLQVEAAWSGQAPLGVLFAVSSTLVVLTQMRVTSRLEGAPVARVMLGGFALMAAAFAVTGAVAAVGLTGWPGLVPPALFVVTLTAGLMVVGPFARSLVPLFAGERRLGAHYGFLASLGGLAVLVGSAGVGAVVQVAPLPVAWLVTAAVPLVSGLALHRLLGRGGGVPAAV